MLAAIRTWSFAPEPGRASLALRLEARFAPETHNVDMRLMRIKSGTKPFAAESDAPHDQGTAAPMSVGSVEPAGPGSPSPAEATAPAAPPVVSEVIPGALPIPSSSPPPSGISSVESVALGPGVPDLILGRRPVVPPLARLQKLSGAVKIIFSVDAEGRTTVHQIDGPEALHAAAQGVVGSWTFRPSTSERVFLVATIAYDAESATAVATVGRRDFGL
jgi:hypothetical protein